jgi:WXXGXW repeat (2 copies)
MTRAFLSRAGRVLALAAWYVAPPARVVEIRAPYAPPAPRYELVPAPPDDRAIWIPGHWHWTRYAYAWRPGHWVEPPQARAVFVPGHWDVRGNAWVWVCGYWR